VDLKCHDVQPGVDPACTRKASSVTAAYSVLSSFERIFCRNKALTRAED
jgi:hypothetical protein